MALKQWIIYSLAEFLGSNSPSCHKIEVFFPLWVDNKHQTFWLIPRVPPLWTTKLQTFLSVSRCTSGAIEKPAKIKKLQTEHAPALLHHSYQILTNKVPKFPDLPLATESLGSYRHFHGTWITCPLQKDLQTIIILKIRTTTPWAFCLSIDLSLVHDLSFTFLPFLKHGLTSDLTAMKSCACGQRVTEPVFHSLNYRWKLHGFMAGWILSFSGSSWIF